MEHYCLNCGKELREEQLICPKCDHCSLLDSFEMASDKLSGILVAAQLQANTQWENIVVEGMLLLDTDLRLKMRMHFMICLSIVSLIWWDETTPKRVRIEFPMDNLYKRNIIKQQKLVSMLHLMRMVASFIKGKY